MVKIILTGSEARQKVKKGLDIVCNVAKGTLGVQGKNVLVKRSYMSTQGYGMVHYPTISTNDGVSIIRHLTLTDAVENMGADLVKEAAEKTMQQAGDSTTSCAVLLQVLVDEGLKMIEGGANPAELKRGIEAAVLHMVGELKKISVPINGDIEKICQVATISANNDQVLGRLIADAFEQIGMDGIIDMAEAKGVTTEIKTAKGFKFDKGFISPYFIRNTAKNDCEFINPLILLYDKKISQMKQIEDILNIAMSENRPLLIIADDCDGEALAGLVANREVVKTVVVRAPEYGDKKREAMEDIAILTGGTFISDEKGNGLKSFQSNNFGQATKVIVTKDETIIIGGKSNDESLETLLSELNTTKNELEGKEKEEIEKRIAKLKGGVAVLYVGANTDIEMKEKWDRIDDAIRATKSAIAEGYIPGGGTAFLHCPRYIDGKDITDFDKGFQIVYIASRSILNQICINAGVDFEPIYKKVLAGKGNIGYNAKTNVVEDLVKAGVIDATKSLRCAFENSASAACIILNMESLICDSL